MRCGSPPSGRNPRDFGSISANCSLRLAVGQRQRHQQAAHQLGLARAGGAGHQHVRHVGRGQPQQQRPAVVGDAQAGRQRGQAVQLRSSGSSRTGSASVRGTSTAIELAVARHAHVVGAQRQRQLLRQVAHRGRCAPPAPASAETGSSAASPRRRARAPAPGARPARARCGRPENSACRELGRSWQSPRHLWPERSSSFGFHKTTGPRPRTGAPATAGKLINAQPRSEQLKTGMCDGRARL